MVIAKGAISVKHFLQQKPFFSTTLVGPLPRSHHHHHEGGVMLAFRRASRRTPSACSTRERRLLRGERRFIHRVFLDDRLHVSEGPSYRPTTLVVTWTNALPIFTAEAPKAFRREERTHDWFVAAVI